MNFREKRFTCNMQNAKTNFTDEDMKHFVPVAFPARGAV